MAIGSDICQELAAAVRQAAQPEMIILFGSQARDDGNAESDVDLLIVQDRRSWKLASRRQEIGRIRRALPDVGHPIDVLLFTSAEVERFRSSQNHVIAEALQHGRVLYERP